MCFNVSSLTAMLSSLVPNGFKTKAQANLICLISTFCIFLPRPPGCVWSVACSSRQPLSWTNIERAHWCAASLAGKSTKSWDKLRHIETQKVLERWTAVCNAGKASSRSFCASSFSGSKFSKRRVLRRFWWLAVLDIANTVPWWLVCLLLLLSP